MLISNHIVSSRTDMHFRTVVWILGDVSKLPMPMPKADVLKPMFGSSLFEGDCFSRVKSRLKIEGGVGFSPRLLEVDLCGVLRLCPGVVDHRS